MFDRFLIVGAGGSGGRTLRLLRQDLRRRLDAAGYNGAFPAAWGFVHVDGPLRPDIDDVGPDPEMTYLSVAADGVSYRELDSLIMQGSPAVRSHVAAWRPDPNRCQDVDPIIGMGQLRAAGRLVTATAMAKLATSLARAYDTVKSASDLELGEISSLMGDESPDHGPIWLIVVSSLAGGAGAGMFLDICDVLRTIDGPPDGRVVSLLYGPDVFDDIEGPGAAGLMPNALGAYSELLASYWDSRPPATNEMALQTVSSLLPRQGEIRRGPTRPFIVSRTNGTVTLERQRDVFCLTASALGAVMVSHTVQREFSQSLSGNWVTSGQRQDTSGLTSGELQPLSALGFASIGIGRDRFAAYAIQRMTGEIAHRLLEGHREQAEPDEQDAAILEAIVRNNLDPFLDACGLREKGKDKNQILDVLRGGEESSWQKRLITEVQSVLSTITSGRTEIDRDKAGSALSSTIGSRSVSFADELRAGREENARRWVRDVQDKLIREATDELTRVGGRGVIALLDATQHYLLDEVLPELRNDIRGWDAPPPVTPKERINSILGQAGRKLRTNSEALTQAARAGIGRWRNAGESALTSLAVDLIDDLVTNCIAPLRRVLTDALATLQEEYDGAPNQPPKLRSWASGAVPDDLLPTAYEALLEDPAAWPDRYGQLIQSQIGAEFADEAIRAAWRQALTTAKPITITAPWSPRTSALRTEDGVRTLRSKALLRQEALTELSRSWLDSADSPFHRFVEEPLDEWLLSRDEGEGEHTRQRRFLASLQHVLDVGRPLVDLDAAALARVHGDAQMAGQLERLLTPLPISVNHRVAADVRRVLEAADFDPAAVTAAMGSSEKNSSYGVVTVLKGPVSPLVINSVAERIASDAAARHRNSDFWFARRTRPLLQAIPAPPAFRLAMLRGWFVGRGLGYIDVTRSQEPRIYTTHGWLGFGPLLGPAPNEAADVLGAILESMPLAIVNAVRANTSALLPYRRLAELGAVRYGVGEDATYDLAADGVSGTLTDWLTSGDLPGGTLEPLVDSAATPNERAELFRAFVDTVFGSYSKLLQGVPKVETQHTHVRRQWELAPAVLDVLGTLRGELATWGTTRVERPSV